MAKNIQCLHIPYALFNAIVHEIINSGRSVQLWCSLVGIVIIDQGSYLWSLSRCRSKVKGQWSLHNFGTFPPITRTSSINWWQCLVVRYFEYLTTKHCNVTLLSSGVVPPEWGGGGGGGVDNPTLNSHKLFKMQIEYWVGLIHQICVILVLLFWVLQTTF